VDTNGNTRRYRTGSGYISTVAVPSIVAHVRFDVVEWSWHNSFHPRILPLGRSRDSPVQAGWIIETSASGEVTKKGGHLDEEDNHDGKYCP